MEVVDKQIEVLKYLKGVEYATPAEILKAMPFGYYHNGEKYIREILTRLIKKGQVERIRRGHYKYLRGAKHIDQSKNQTKLF